MSELKINDLPPEMITKVFRFLGVESLKSATLTCKLWNNLIESSYRWSLELVHELNDELWCKRNFSAEQKMNFILTTNRKFGNLSIRGGRLRENSQILKILEKHGFNVVDLTLSGCRIDNLAVLAELLTRTSNLKHADFQSIYLHDTNDLQHQILPNLKKLKNLEMYGTDSRFIKCFQKAKLTTLKVQEYGRWQHYGPLVDFLSSQNTLTSLTAANVTVSRLAEMGRLTVPASFPFRLTQLNISSSFDQYTSHDHDNFLEFLKSQSDNLRVLEMGFHHPSSVYQCVFARMLKLNSLSVVTNQIPQGNDFYERLKENRSVRTIELLEIGISQFLCNFLKKLPSIRNLILLHTGNSTKSTLVAAAQNLEKLESLYFEVIHERLFDCVKFSNLKTLNIQLLRVKIDWNEFTKIHPRLAELTIERMLRDSCLTNNDIDQITTNVDLKRIQLGFGFVADDQFFEIIRTKCTNLKVLDLHKSCISQGLNYSIGINVLRLCDDFDCSKTVSSILYGDAKDFDPLVR